MFSLSESLFFHEVEGKNSICILNLLFKSNLLNTHSALIITEIGLLGSVGTTCSLLAALLRYFLFICSLLNNNITNILILYYITCLREPWWKLAFSKFKMWSLIIVTLITESNSWQFSLAFSLSLKCWRKVMFPRLEVYAPLSLKVQEQLKSSLSNACAFCMLQGLLCRFS